MKNFFSTQKKNITLDTLKTGTLKCEYAVRGRIPLLAGQITGEIKSGSKKYPFQSTTECNIGNPQTFGQPPITFIRNVLSCLLSPQEMDRMPFHQDVKNRAKLYQSHIPQSIGAYSDSMGYMYVRENIAKFIEKRDGFQCSPQNIMITDGASSGIRLTFDAILKDKNDGVMIPIPQYPLYSALITQAESNGVPYYLKEEQGWQIDTQDLEKSLKDAQSKGINVKAMVIINPGNPTGNILSQGTIENIIKFCATNGIAIMADEVYQQNIYKKDTKFISFKKVLSQMKSPYSDIEMFSYHSTSKGIIGECGLRGGYMEFVNIDPKVVDMLIKLKSVFLCSNTVGQIATDLMVNPPSNEDCSQETIDIYNNEVNTIFAGLTKRAQIVSESLNKMKNITCNEVEGAMYAFPRLYLGQKAVEEAKRQGMHPDVFYCKLAVEKTGIVFVPGSGFMQEEGTYHLRTTILIRPDERLHEAMKSMNAFNDWFHNTYP